MVARSVVPCASACPQSLAGGPIGEPDCRPFLKSAQNAKTEKRYRPRQQLDFAPIWLHRLAPGMSVQPIARAGSDVAGQLLVKSSCVGRLLRHPGIPPKGKPTRLGRMCPHYRPAARGTTGPKPTRSFVFHGRPGTAPPTVPSQSYTLYPGYPPGQNQVSPSG